MKRKILLIFLGLLIVLIIIFPRLLFKTFKTDSYSINIPRWWQSETVAPLTRIFDSKTNPTYQIEIYITPSAISLADFIYSFDQAASYSARPNRISSQISNQPAVVETGLHSGSPYISYYLKHPSKDLAYIITSGGNFRSQSAFVKYLISTFKFLPP